MNGFRDDVISILRDNVMFHGEAVGLIMTASDNNELYRYLQDNKFPVARSHRDPILTFDYIVIPVYDHSISSLLLAFSVLRKNGIIILDVSDWDRRLLRDYKCVFADFTATSLNYGDRAYIVIHSGVDYGN